jgi:zinc transporter, ZIP family
VSGILEAAFWGLVGASALILGAVLAFAVDVPIRARGLIQGFGAGVLFGAVAYDLIGEAIRQHAGGFAVGIGFGLGAVAFFVGSVLIDRIPASGSAPDGKPGGTSSAGATAGLAILLGTVLDGIPESLVLGLSFVPGAGVALPILLAVFVSNVPEALSATEDLADSGYSRGRILRIWVAVTLTSAAAAGLGFATLDVVGPQLIAATQAFAAGALLAMLAESMIPEGYAAAGRPVGLTTSLGFAVAAFLSLQG